MNGHRTPKNLAKGSHAISEKSLAYSLRLPPELFRKIRAMAQKNNRSFNRQVVTMLSKEKQ